MKIKKPELMCPIRDWASLEACKDYADAVFFGVSDLSLRVNADAFTMGDMPRFVKKCHSYKIKAYLTINAVLYNEDIPKAEKLIKKAKTVGVDAVIVWDPAAIEIAKKEKMTFFISTQANIANWQTAKFYAGLGAKRIVLAREMSLRQIKELRKKVDIEIETFVHGAMCMAISGRCVLSGYLYGKSANCGACAQPCRKEWILSDSEGNKISVDGKSFLSAKDLNMIAHIPELIKAGIDSFKIEGRRRDPRYIGITARCYREAIDAYFANTYTKEKITRWNEELSQVYNRGYSTGFYFGVPGSEGIGFDKSDNLSPVKKAAVGYILNYFLRIGVAEIRLNQRGIKVGETILVEGKTTFLEQKIASMEMENTPVERAHKGQNVAVKLNKKVRAGDRVAVLVER